MTSLIKKSRAVLPACFLFAVWFILLALYAVFSYSATDYNLTLTSSPLYWSLQNFLWQTVFQNKQLLASAYFLLIVLLYLCYGFVLWFLSTVQISTRQFWILLVGSCVVLLGSYNALSYDVFNYMFNAKMVLQYHANPHQQVALEFPDDPWVRFMHNTHTPAPYGYAWTGISLLPAWLGADTFIVTWILFRVFSIVSIVFLAALLFAWLKRTDRDNHPFWVAVVVLNPLLLLEIVGNSHNDLWMMVPAMLSVLLLLERVTIKRVALAILFLLISIQIKLATVVLIPLVTILALQNSHVFGRCLKLTKVSPGVFKKQLNLHAGGVAAVLLFPLLLTERSTIFHPWYFTWILVWVPFIRFRFLQLYLIALSMSSLLRYIPWLYAGGYTDQVLEDRGMITWWGSLVILLVCSTSAVVYTRFLRSRL